MKPALVRSSKRSLTNQRTWTRRTELLWVLVLISCHSYLQDAKLLCRFDAPRTLLTMRPLMIQTAWIGGNSFHCNPWSSPDGHP